MIQKLCFILDIQLTYTVACPSNQAFMHLSQVVGVSCLDNSLSKMQNYSFVVLELLNFVINIIFVIIKANRIILTTNV